MRIQVSKIIRIHGSGYTTLVKSSVIFVRRLNFFFNTCSNKNYFKFCEICGYKKKARQHIFSPSSFAAVVGSGIQDPGSEMDKISIRYLR